MFTNLVGAVKKLIVMAFNLWDLEASVVKRK
jgi:hypothetical protein